MNFSRDFPKNHVSSSSDTLLTLSMKLRSCEDFILKYEECGHVDDSRLISMKEHCQFLRQQIEDLNSLYHLNINHLYAPSNGLSNAIEKFLYLPKTTKSSQPVDIMKTPEDHIITTTSKLDRGKHTTMSPGHTGHMIVLMENRIESSKFSLRRNGEARHAPSDTDTDTDTPLREMGEDSTPIAIDGKYRYAVADAITRQEQKRVVQSRDGETAGKEGTNGVSVVHQATSLDGNIAITRLAVPPDTHPSTSSGSSSGSWTSRSGGGDKDGDGGGDGGLDLRPSAAPSLFATPERYFPVGGASRGSGTRRQASSAAPSSPPSADSSLDMSKGVRVVGRHAHAR